MLSVQVAGEESWATIDAIPVKPFTTITDKYNITTRYVLALAKVHTCMLLLAS
jgi:hypothetical protein